MEEDNSRQSWNSKVGFIVAAIGSAVGLGNIWRFPYVLYENGGGGFLIPYFIAIFTAAIPLLILEYTMGSRFRASAPLAFARNNPKFEWVGWIPTFISILIILYYSSIVSWAINYLFLSINMAWTDAPSDFFFGEFLQLSDSPFHVGGINVSVLIGLAVIWGGTFLLCSKSIDKGIEKVNKVLLPLLGISILCVIIRGVSLEGAVDGLNTLFTPDFSALLKPKVWVSAYSQVFYSLSVAMGIMITYSSYLPKKTDVVNTAYITGFANSAFELSVAIGVFGILGYMANQQGVPVTEVVSSGVGLAFVVFPTAFNLMGSLGSFLGIVFFASLVFAGFTSFVSLTEAFITPFVDKFNVERKKMYGYVCAGGFLISSVYATGAGLYILDIVDYFINSFAILFVGIVEAIVVGYVFKLDSYQEYANKHSLQKVGTVWKVAILAIVPVFLTFNLVLYFYDTFKNGYGGYDLNALLFYGLGTLIELAVFTFIVTKLPWANKDALNFVEEE